MLKSKINVLGSTWEVKVVSSGEDDLLQCDTVGYCDYTIKTIVALDGANIEYADKKVFVRDTLIHEAIHAFLNESGLKGSSEWAGNEEMVDWFANQFYKIYDTVLDIEDICDKLFTEEVDANGS